MADRSALLLCESLSTGVARQMQPSTVYKVRREIGESGEEERIVRSRYLSMSAWYLMSMTDGEGDVIGRLQLLCCQLLAVRTDRAF